VGLRVSWSSIPLYLRVYFNSVEMHIIVIEDTLQSVLGSNVVGPRRFPIDLGVPL
jgi:hypothetical protein